MLRAIDTHAHLDFPQYDTDRVELIRHLHQERIGVINIATDEQSIEKVDRLARENQLIWGAVGLHPTEVTNETLQKVPQAISLWQNLIKGNPKIVAIGEVGLDYFHDNSRDSANRQRAALKQFLTFAADNHLPLIFHCREAYGDLATILGDYRGIRGVVHCFSGQKEQAQTFLDLGLQLSFTANITYPKNDFLLDLAANLPLESIMLETDCPFLSVISKRGSRNDPMAVIEIAEIIAKKRAVKIEEVLQQTTKNAEKLFKL